MVAPIFSMIYEESLKDFFFKFWCVFPSNLEMHIFWILKLHREVKQCWIYEKT